MEIRCNSCGQIIEINDRISREEICPECRSDLHCCTNCGFYDEYAQNRCRESAAEWVSDRGKNNFCEFFNLGQGGVAAAKSAAREEARARLEALFKKK